MRILIFGNSGSGKSTLAKKFSQEHALQHLDLDSIVWQPGEIAVQRSEIEIHAALNDFLRSNDHWVIEGCYGELIELASASCSELLFLNPGLDACLANNLRRPWEPEKYANADLQNSMLENLNTWVKSYYQRDDAWSYIAHRQIFDAFKGQKREI